MLDLVKGRYRVRVADSDADVLRAQELRHLCFHGTPGRDSDGFDTICAHGLVEDRADGALVGCFRLLPIRSGSEVHRSYAAQHYELSRLESFAGPMVELGRFCIRPDLRDADVLRAAWGALTVYVDREGIEMLFGCASFAGADWRAHAEALAMLRARHLGPAQWRPRIKAPTVVRFAQRLRRAPDARQAMRDMPSLLRTYLAMGGWVSDHAVVDLDMNTLHVFTGVEIGRIPAARSRALRSVTR